jgi:hypothetical protein
LAALPAASAFAARATVRAGVFAAILGQDGQGRGGWNDEGRQRRAHHQGAFHEQGPRTPVMGGSAIKLNLAS